MGVGTPLAVVKERIVRRIGTTRPSIIPCSAFGGVSPRTGEKVGSRHRWSGPGWGRGTCVYCGQTLDQVRS